ncbi:MAG: CAP domain-containing protein [Planctomycetota bacterium]|nr:CAP domain-containing protein [Planctomycetota bacterium]
MLRQESLEGRVFRAVNREREKAGLPPLRLNRILREVAWEHTRDMARHGFLEHRGSDGSLVENRLSRRRLEWVEAAENVARNKGYADPVQEALRAWMNSPEHRHNILSPRFSETGIAVCRSQRDHAYYFTQVFALCMPQ